MELLDFKSNLILKTKFDALSCVPGTHDVINFWRSLPCENSQNKKIRLSCIYVVLKRYIYANKHYRPRNCLAEKRGSRLTASN